MTQKTREALTKLQSLLFNYLTFPGANEVWMSLGHAELNALHDVLTPKTCGNQPTAPPQEAAPMPPIEPGDWVHEDGEKEAVIVREMHQAKSLNRGIRLSGIIEIRKANGNVWRRQ